MQVFHSLFLITRVVLCPAVQKHQTQTSPGESRRSLPVQRQFVRCCPIGISSGETAWGRQTERRAPIPQNDAKTLKNCALLSSCLGRQVFLFHQKCGINLLSFIKTGLKKEYIRAASSAFLPMCLRMSSLSHCMHL